MLLRRRIPRREAIPDGTLAAREFRWEAFPFNWHQHPELELTRIIRGTGQRLVGDSIESFAPGDLCLIGADTPHCWVSVPENGRVHSQVIQFSAILLADAAMRWPELARWPALLERSRQGLHITGATQRRLLPMLDRFFARGQSTLLLFELLIQLCSGGDPRSLSLCAAPSLRDSRGEDLVARALAELQTHAADPPSQGALAAKLHVSPAIFTRLFKRRMGKTYSDYVNDFRVSQVCRLLIETNRPITEVAFACGFRTLANFNRRFRAIKGLTPRQFRAMAARSSAGATSVGVA